MACQGRSEEKEIHPRTIFNHRANPSIPLVLRQGENVGLGGRGWTERQRRKPRGFGLRPPTPATLKLSFYKSLVTSELRSRRLPAGQADEFAVGR